MDNTSIALIIIYSFLYISHIILGPYYYSFLIKGQKPKYIVKSPIDLLQKSVYITYISMLLTIYFLINPNTETYSCGFIMTLVALVAYIIKYDKSEYLIESIVLHTLLLLPYIFYKFYYDIQIKLYEPTFMTYLTIILLISYYFFQDIIY